jgi:hypothetical protein
MVALHLKGPLAGLEEMSEVDRQDHYNLLLQQQLAIIDTPHSREMMLANDRAKDMFRTWEYMAEALPWYDEVPGRYVSDYFDGGGVLTRGQMVTARIEDNTSFNIGIRRVLLIGTLHGTLGFAVCATRDSFFESAVVPFLSDDSPLRLREYVQALETTSVVRFTDQHMWSIINMMNTPDPEPNSHRERNNGYTTIDMKFHQWTVPKAPTLVFGSKPGTFATYRPEPVILPVTIKKKSHRAARDRVVKTNKAAKDLINAKPTTRK